MSAAFDEGATFFKNEPELLVAAVWHVAAKAYEDRDTQQEFVNGYITARRQHDEWRKEKNTPHESDEKK